MQNFNSRYSRMASLPEIGPEGIALLNSARVLVIGCGALGSLCAMYLAASGVGHVAIADFDTIDISNLQRQLFFSEQYLGKLKADTLASRMSQLNSEINVEVIQKMITEELALELFPQYDIVIDGSDNPNTKLMTDAISCKVGVSAVIAGVRGFEGQVMCCLPNTTRYADVFGNNPPCSGFTPCSIGGVIGPAAGVAASIQAAETIKYITKVDDLLADRVLFFNLLSLDFRVISL